MNKIRYGKIIRMTTDKEAEVEELGGSQKLRQISPRGLCSKPPQKKNDAIIIPILNGNSQDIILAIQNNKELPLKDGDVGLTDGKSFIHLVYNKGSIIIKGSDILIESSGNLTLSAKNIKMKANSVTHGIKNIGGSHQHTTKAHVHGNTAPSIPDLTSDPTI